MNEINEKENQPKKGLDSQSLPEHIHDDSTGLDYTLIDGCYYLPDFLSENEAYSPGIWARRHLLYLKECRPSKIIEMRTYNLDAYLNRIDKRAEGMYESLVEQMAEREGLTEELKLKDQMTWVGLANSIRHRAEEIVKAEVIYS